MQIKLSWEEYQAFALKAITEKYSSADTENIEFMNTSRYESDSSAYNLPDYILINIK